MSDKSDLARDKNITRNVHRLFWQAMMRDKRNFAIATLHYPSFFIFNALIPLQVAYVLQAIFQRSFGSIDMHIYLIIIYAIVAVSMMYIANQADSRMGINAAGYLQRQAFSNFLNKDYDFYSSRYAGSIGAQVAQLRDAFTQYVHEFKFVIEKNLTIVIGILIILAINSWQLFLISLVIIIIKLGYTFQTSRKRLTFRRASSEAGSFLAGVEADAISHGMTVKSFAAEDFEIDYSQNSALTWQKAQLKAWASLEPSNSIRVAMSYATIAILLLAAAYLYENNLISIAMVVLAQLYMFRIINVSLDVADVIKQYEHIMGLAYRPVSTMLIKPTINDPARPQKLPSFPKSIRFNSVSFAYPDHHARHKALDVFDLTLKKGEKVGLVGYSGAGKSTLTKLILRFMDIDEGSIELDGIDIRKVRQFDLRKKIAYVPQEPLLFHRSIKENIAYGRPEAKDSEIIQAAKLAYVDEFVRELPKGYDTLVGERGVKLSGGQRQRVAIARAILKDAPILVLDEATSALDSRSEKYIQTALWKLMKGRTALVIAHRLSTVQRMDKIVVMDKGCVVQSGSHEELLKEPGIYADLWAHQSGGYIGAKSEEE